MDKFIVTHIIERLTRGGGSRATMYLAKYSARKGPYIHQIVSLEKPESEAVTIAQEMGLEVVHITDYDQLKGIIEKSDIVQTSWWNNPRLYNLFMGTLPDMRLLGWFHVGGSVAPQVITERLLEFFDFGIACSPYTYQCPAFERKIKKGQGHKLKMVYGATDFERLHGLTRKPHSGFNVGYIGTLHHQKMHPDYAKLSMSINIPDVKFLLAGSGGAETSILREAHLANRGTSFEFVGYVEDVRDLLSVLDVYGYPLCKDTYAASEMNLQEVMYAGIPPVVFPYGGIKELIQHNKTGLVVNSAQEYKEAIEFLYNNPNERQRIGANAEHYAKEIFGAENAATEANKIYQEALMQPKRSRSWFPTCSEVINNERSIQLSDIFKPEDAYLPARQFIDSLGEHGEIFLTSITSHDGLEVLEADLAISSTTELMKTGGVGYYSRAFPKDPILRYWMGLIAYHQGNFLESMTLFVDALQNGRDDWQIMWWLYRSATKANDFNLAKNAGNRLALYLETHPQKVDIQKRLAVLDTNC